MNQRQLKYFLEVYEAGSITQAAQKLFISPQGLSKTILALEEELGQQLFVRNGRKMVPTNAAVRLTAHAKNIIEEYRLIENGRFITEEPVKLLYIPVCYDVMQYFPPEFFQEFHVRYPNIVLKFEENPDLHIQELLQSEQASLAILPGPINTQELHMEYLFTNRFCFLIHRKNPLSERESLTLDALGNQALLIKSSTILVSQIQLNDLMRHNSRANVIMETTDIRVIEKMVAHNYVIGMTLDYLTGHIDRTNIAVCPMSGENATKTIYLCYLQKNLLDRNARIFRDYLLDWLQGHQDERLGTNSML